MIGRTMSDLPNYITPAGHARLVNEVEQLQRVERPRIVQEVADAAAQGDRSENAEYIYGKKRLREIDRRLNFLARRLKNVQVVDPAQQSGDRVFFGAYVEVEDEEARTLSYQIVGEDEVDPTAGKISWKSPLGRALLKKRAGDTVTIKRPGGEEMEYTLLAVRYGA
jgi:transcription elongation factor GreB